MAWSVGLMLAFLQLCCSGALGQDIVFTRPVYNATIAENSPIRTYISTEQKMGVYLPNSSVTVRYNIDDRDFRELFSAGEETVGDFCFLRVRTKPCRKNSQCSNLKVNREVRSVYDLHVSAVVTGSSTKTSTATIHLVVKDVNEQPPLFLKGSYQASVREDYPVFSNIIQVESHDSDSGINGEVYYSFRQQTDQFAIHTTTGVVSLTRPLDYDQETGYTLTVEAKDRGFTPYSTFALKSSVQLRIDVTQVNSHNPVITIEKQPTISRNSPVGTVFAVVMVTDEDDGVNGEITALDITDGNLEGSFEVVQTATPGRYQLQIARSLSTSMLPQALNVTIAATDGGLPSKSSSAVVGINLDGAMYFEYYFTDESFNTTISELMPVNTPFLSLAPPSAKGNTGIFYAIKDSSDLTFSIGTHTGVLSVAKDLDRETKAVHEIKVEARNAKQQGVAETKVVINLADANDNDPVFEEEDYTVQLEENKPAYYAVLRVRALDPDLGENGFISYSLANINQIPFTIDHRTGYINTSKVLDYETMRHEYKLRVRASDWGSPYRRETEVVVTVRLINVNDNKPKFEKIACVGTIAKSFPPGRAIALISALDFDGNRPRYRILDRGNVNDLFSLNPSTGNLTLARAVADGDPYFYSLKIEARDGPESVSYMMTNLTINIANPNPQAHARGLKVSCQETSVADEIVELVQQLEQSNQEVEDLPPGYSNLFAANLHTPSFDETFRSSVTVPEDAPVGSTVLTVSATDLDHGFNGKLLYAIPDGNEKSHFQMDFETGELKVLMPLDRESLSVYEMTVQVSDMGTVQFSQKRHLTITLQDVNDNAPQFDLGQYEVTIPEDAEEGLVFLAVHASDRDEGRNQEVQYSIISDSPAFGIDALTGEISVTGPLDRETQPIHEVRVQATDQGDSPLSSSVIVKVTLADINDNPPQCLLNEYKVKVREDIPTGAAVLTVQAHDPDNPPNGTVHYRLDVSGPSKFSIDTDYGTLRLIERLDFEETQMYEIVVAIRDEGIPAMSSSCRILVEVVDVNENIHAPVFENYVLTGSVYEGHASNTEVMTVTAQDMDMGVDGEVSYTIRDGSGLGRFSIDNSGVIRTTEELDRESTPHYWLTVYAQDRGAIPLHSVVQVFIQVLDINDNAPLPTRPVFRASIPENTPTGVAVVTVEARDPDTSSNNSLSYRIKTNSARKYFDIDESTGVISTGSKNLDREAKKGAEHNFEVEISDNGQPTLKSIAKVVITVEDENDNDPKFVDPSMSISVQAMDMPDERRHIYRMMATDKDVGSNAELSYFIRDGNTGSRFYIDATTGEVTCSKTLQDEETYVLEIEVKDNGPSERRSSRARLTVHVTPAAVPSANTPMFEMFDDIPQRITESDPVNYLVTYVFASDLDFDEVRYTITAGNDDGAFFIHPLGGIITVAQPLDSETKSSYDLTIAASDGFNQVSGSLHIDVADVNDNAPILEQELYEVVIAENTRVNTPILTIVATDRDASDRILYTLPSTAEPSSLYKFRIDTRTGVIYLNESLDHESQRQHILNIEVKDYNLGQHRTYARVVVNVSDANDHMPEFRATSFQGKVFETAAIGTRVVDVYAFDRDQGSNAELTYSISQGNVGDAFNIDPILGTLTVGQELDIEQEAEYSLVVRATDHGNQSLSNTCHVNVSVTLSNNAPPRFRDEVYMAEVSENLLGNQFVTQISAVSRSSVYYEITRGDDARRFDINPNSGVITTTEPLDYEDVTVYNLTVQATNMVGLRTNACIIIHVQDVNDNAPIFSASEYVGSISESASLKSVVLDEENQPLVISAFDADSGHNAHLVYEINEQDAQMYFTIDESTGAIRTKMPLDHENIPEFEFTVHVRDTGSPHMRAESPARVRITIIDINDSQPKFIKDVFDATLLLPTYTGVFVLKVTAVDDDEVSLSRLSYSIHLGDNRGHFNIDADTGDIYVSNRTNMDTEYDLTVRVSDGLNFNNARVLVHVLPRPVSGLRFPANECYTIIRENSSTVHDVAVLAVLGNTLNEPLYFSILNPSPMFSIRATSGIVRNTGIPFDRERQDRYHIVVEARDRRVPARVAHIIVNVEILDVNDNPPVFIHHQYNAIVQVDASVGEVVRQVTAIDRDIGKNGEVQYTLVQGGDGLFKIDSVSGLVLVQRPLGANSQNKNFTLKIKASDKGKPPHSAVVDVPITVRNKAMPVFDEQYYHASIPEDLELHSAVRQIQAISPHGRELIYSIGEGDDFNQFDINPLTGVINLVGAVDYEARTHYSLQVLASDTLTGASAMVTVDIEITDVNDVAPSFDQKVYRAVLSEAAAVGSTVLQVGTADRDSPKNAGVRYRIVPSNNRTSYFHMAASSGLILTSHVLDYETHASHEFVVVATDSGMPPLRSETRVSILVTDMNDNPPRFIHRDYFCAVSEIADRGAFVTSVSATDPDISDVDKLTYSIVTGNEDMTFSIDKKTGIISLSNSHRPQLLSGRGYHQLNVSVSDRVFTSSATVHVNVTRVNRNAPSFSQDTYITEFMENGTTGEVVFQVVASDDDPMDQDQLTYSILSAEARRMFDIDSETGVLMSRHSIDGDTSAIKSRMLLDLETVNDRMLRVPIMVVDTGGNTAFTTVKVILNDKNDNAPRFEMKEYHAYVSPNSMAGEPLIAVTATDIDSGSNALLTYFFANGTDQTVSDLFVIDSKTGTISAATSLFGEEGSTFQFFVGVEDGGNPAQSWVTAAEIYVLAPDDELPIFAAATNAPTIEVAENTPVGTRLATFEAWSNNSITYTLVPGNDAHTNNPARFSIDEYGNLTLVSMLDFEMESSYKLMVKASTASDPVVSSYYAVLVTVADMNDNMPIFEDASYNLRVPENTPVNKPILRVIAIDADSGTNAQVLYDLDFDNEEEVLEKFEVNEMTGVLSIREELDRETAITHDVIVQARDADNPDFTATTTVHVTVMDFNDMMPRFTKKLYDGQVLESDPIGTVTVSVQAPDGDVGANAKVVYYITSGDPFNHFAIENTSGKIYVANSLDRELKDAYRLNVTATDGLYSDTCQVVISVEDVNDNRPVCAQTLYAENIQENLDPGHYILQVTASDADIGSNADITYSLEGEGAEYFTIEKTPENTGTIRTSGRLDYEAQHYYRFRMVASDGGGLSCSSDISIGLIDENDNPPAFTQSVYNLSVSENTTANTLLTRVQAVDPDTGANRRHRFSVLDAEGVFTLDENSGVLALMRGLDRENRSQYNLTLVATDLLESSLASHAQLIVNVLDENDNEPQFESDLYNASVSEDAAVESVVITVVALSQDVGLNAKIMYQIVSGNEHGKFRIDNSRGEIIVANSLDFEMSSNYFLTVEAMDMGTNPLSDSTTVNIHVRDANDNSPIFSQDFYSTNVNEAARVHGDVIQVMAEDADSGLYGQVTYSILHGNLFNQFTINPSNGLISLASQLDREQISSYNLVVRASDGGEEPQTTDVTVQVIVDDINDNPPLMPQKNFTIIRQEDTPMEADLLQLNATDLDTPANGPPFTFTITGGNTNGAFSISHTNVLRNRIFFNRDVESQYNLTIRVTDSGRPELYSLSYVKIIVTDPMNVPEVVSPMHIAVNSYENTFPGGWIGRVKASDRDPYDALTFGVQEGDVFHVNADDGTLISPADLDEGDYPLNVSVSDGHFTVFADVTVSVQILTQDMLNNSITIPFLDVTPADFLNYRGIFTKAVANQFSVSQEDVIILAIHESASNADNTDVVFAIQRPRQRDSYFKPKQIQRQGDAITRELENRLQLRVGTLVGDLCRADMCVDNYACENVVDLDVANILTYTTDHESFVSSRHSRKTVCICALDSCVSTPETGDTTTTTTTVITTTTMPLVPDKVTPRHPCTSSPCHSNMECREVDDTDYVCECPDRSQSCLPSQDEAMNFNGESYVTYTGLELSTSSTELTSSINTDRSEGTIIHATGDFDYSILEIVNGYLVYRFNCGTGEARISITQKKVNDFKWHMISISQDNNHAVLSLDGAYATEGTAPGNNRDLNLNTVTIGAMPPSKTFQGRKRRAIDMGYVGCMGGLSLNGEALPILGESVKPHNVGKCPRNWPAECLVEHCKNGGECFSYGYSFTCDCPKGWSGETCEDRQECTVEEEESKKCCRSDSTVERCKVTGGEEFPVITTGFPMKLIIIIISVIVGIIIIVVVLAVCRYHRKKQRSRYPPRDGMGHTYNDDDYKRDSKLSDDYPLSVPLTHINSHPSNVPPPLPTRPASYTRSNHNSLNNLDRDRHDDMMYHGQPISMQPTLPPVPSNSASDSDSIAKPSWEFDTPSTHNSCVDGRDSNKGLSPHPLQHSQPCILPPVRRTVPAPMNIPHPPSESPPAYRAVNPNRPEAISMTSVNTENDDDGLRALGVRQGKKGFQWDYSDWVQHSESLQNIPGMPPRRGRDSPTNLSTNTSQINDYETDDEYVGGDDTDYPTENDEMLPCARAAMAFRKELENYPPAELEMDDEFERLLPPDVYTMGPGHYLPSHSVSTSEIPPEYDDSRDPSSASCVVPQRSNASRLSDFPRPISDISQDALSMSMYTSTNASCSDVSGMCDEIDSDTNLSDNEDFDDHLANLKSSTDV